MPWDSYVPASTVQFDSKFSEKFFSEALFPVKWKASGRENEGGGGALLTNVYDSRPRFVTKKPILPCTRHLLQGPLAAPKTPTF